MILSNYEIIYIFTGLFGVYIINRFMRIFFEKKVTSKLIEIISYAVYFFLITYIFFEVNVPIILVLTNIIGFIGLSFNYKAKLIERIMGAVYIFLILMIVELFVGIATGYFGISVFEINSYDNSFALIVVKVLSYIVVLLMDNFKNVKKGNHISMIKWFSVVGIPVISLYLIIVVFQSSVLVTTQVLVSIISLLAINILVFNLYDTLQLDAEKDIERKLLIQQTKYYNNQFNLMQSSEQAMSTIRHELKNHLSSILGLIDRKENLKAFSYIQEILNMDRNNYRYVNTGNNDIDSILNFKIQEGYQRNIEFDIDIIIPEMLFITAFDLTTILSNILDNAIEATSKIKEDPLIQVVIKYNKGRLIIKVSNPFGGEIKFVDGIPATTKSNIKNHGIGIKQVKKALRKYNGDIEMTSSKNVFNIMILMYVEQE